jgi:hypothetical protein
MCGSRVKRCDSGKDRGKLVVVGGVEKGTESGASRSGVHRTIITSQREYEGEGEKERRESAATRALRVLVVVQDKDKGTWGRLCAVLCVPPSASGSARLVVARQFPVAAIDRTRRALAKSTSHPLHFLPAMSPIYPPMSPFLSHSHLFSPLPTSEGAVHRTFGRPSAQIHIRQRHEFLHIRSQVTRRELRAAFDGDA